MTLYIHGGPYSTLNCPTEKLEQKEISNQECNDNLRSVSSARKIRTFHYYYTD